jgi:hypothetical protein
MILSRKARGPIELIRINRMLDKILLEFDKYEELLNTPPFPCRKLVLTFNNWGMASQSIAGIVSIYENSKEFSDLLQSALTDIHQLGVSPASLKEQISVEFGIRGFDYPPQEGEFDQEIVLSPRTREQKIKDARNIISNIHPGIFYRFPPDGYNNTNVLYEDSFPDDDTEKDPTDIYFLNKIDFDPEDMFSNNSVYKYLDLLYSFTFQEYIQILRKQLEKIKEIKLEELNVAETNSIFDLLDKFSNNLRTSIDYMPQIIEKCKNMRDKYYHLYSTLKRICPQAHLTAELHPELILEYGVSEGIVDDDIRHMLQNAGKNRKHKKKTKRNTKKTKRNTKKRRTYKKNYK